MQVKVLPALSDNYVYLLIDGGAAAVVDPSDAGVVRTAVDSAGCDLAMILVTHHHFDHTAGCPALSDAYGCPVTGPACQGGARPDRVVADGDVVELGEERIEVLGVPGHTREHVVYHARRHGAVFTGDTLFAGGCGRVMGATAAAMWRSLVRLRSLPDGTLVYCGHDYSVDNLEFAQSLEPGNPAVAARLEALRSQAAAGLPTVPSTILLEKQTNPFLRCDGDEMRRAAGLPRGSGAEVFGRIRQMKDRW
jgi:hydroxyacylglutathione hydrolase